MDVPGPTSFDDDPAIGRVLLTEEQIATRIAEVCAVDSRVMGTKVTVRKLHPPVRAMVDHVAVSVER